MSESRVYLDHISATPVLPEVREAMLPYFSEHFGNPSSIHQTGMAARNALKNAREQVGSFISANRPENIIFTSSGTESINIAIKGMAKHAKRRGNHIVCTATAHPAVLESIEFLKNDGITCTKVPVDAVGKVDLARVKEAMKKETFLLVSHAANYDIGTIQPLLQLGEIAANHDASFMVEANYAGGWLPLEVEVYGIDLLTLSPHRFYGPKGVGVLYRNPRSRLAPLFHGGSQEDGFRAGTENIPAIVGAGVAAEYAGKYMGSRVEHVAKMQSRLWDKLKATVPLLKINGPEPGPQRLVTNLNFSAEFTEGEGLMLMCDTKGFSIGSGTACVFRNLKVSAVLEAMGVSPDLAKAAVLVSPGKDTTEDEVDRFAAVFPSLVEKLRKMSPNWDLYQAGRYKSLVSGKMVK